jgi:hypothetical protein
MESVLNFVQSHSVKEKNAWNSVPYHFAEEKKHSEFWSEALSEKKI